MGLFDYYNKRDSKGSLLGYSALVLDRDMTNDCFMKIKSYGVYNELSTYLNDELLEIYFKKYFYEYQVDII